MITFNETLWNYVLNDGWRLTKAYTHHAFFSSLLKWIDLQSALFSISEMDKNDRNLLFASSYEIVFEK
jgi:hypothetical protein